MIVQVLNADYSFLHNITWQKAVTLLCKGKVEVVKESKRIISNFDKSVTIVLPMIVRVIKFVSRIYKNKVPYSKKGVFTRDRNTCQYCDTVLNTNKCTIDHVIPKAKGGKSSWTNCVTSCSACNNEKGDKDLNDTRFYLNRSPVKPLISDFLRLKSLNVVVDI